MNLSGSGMVAVTRDALAGLRNALMRDSGNAAGYLQEAGYAGGESLFETFRQWLAAHGESDPESLPFARFQDLAAEFFRETGWGSLSIGALSDAVATLDSGDWTEAEPNMGMEQPCCHLSSGMFADFFGRMAGAPLAVMEVECRSTGAERCRFLLGSPEVLQHVYEGMAAGVGYEDVLANA